MDQMKEIMNVGAWVTISVGYIFVGYVVWTESKEIFTELKKDDKKRKNSAEETAEQLNKS